MHMSTLCFYQELITSRHLAGSSDIIDPPIDQLHSLVVTLARQTQENDGTLYVRVWPEDTFF